MVRRLSTLFPTFGRALIRASFKTSPTDAELAEIAFSAIRRYFDDGLRRAQFQLEVPPDRDGSEIDVRERRRLKPGQRGADRIRASGLKARKRISAGFIRDRRRRNARVGVCRCNRDARNQRSAWIGDDPAQLGILRK